MVAIREAFGKALAELGAENEQVVVLDADLASSTRTTYFSEKFPKRFIQCGIAEQNMVGVAAGLAMTGKIPFAATFAVFITKRALDQVTISIAYPRLNVKMVGAYTGLFNGKTGASHMAVEDISIMRAVPGMVVVDPADEHEMASAVFEIARYDGPVYLRETRDQWPPIFSPSYKFRLGKASLVREGEDAGIISSGVMTSVALEAAEALKQEGIKVMVLNMSTIKPLDRGAVVTCAKKTGAVVTAENHNIYGGLGSAVAEVLAEEYPCSMARIGIPDALNEAGENEQLLKKYGMSSRHIVKAVKDLLKKAR